jgi:hypothetical protein
MITNCSLPSVYVGPSQSPYPYPKQTIKAQSKPAPPIYSHNNYEPKDTSNHIMAHHQLSA